jgi:hypothetical protein
VRAIGLRYGLRKPIHQQHAIRQTGHRIMMREVFAFGNGRGERLFSSPALFDIGRRGDPLTGIDRRIVKGHAADKMPPIHAVGTAQACFALELPGRHRSALGGDGQDAGGIGSAGKSQQAHSCE